LISLWKMRSLTNLLNFPHLSSTPSLRTLLYQLVKTISIKLFKILTKNLPITNH
jgi:hypothetical protein